MDDVKNEMFEAMQTLNRKLLSMSTTDLNLVPCASQICNIGVCLWLMGGVSSGESDIEETSKEAESKSEEDIEGSTEV